MKFVTQFFFLTVLFFNFLFFSAEANSDPCFKSSNQNTLECHKYNYDRVTAFFRDEMSIEQKVNIKRVLSKSTGQLLHADYDFEVQCPMQYNCVDTDAVTISVLWSFRNAVLNNGVYTVSYESCNPAEEICCRDGICSEIYRVDTPHSKNTAKTDINNSEGALASTPPHRRESTLQKVESVTNIMDNIMRNSQNGADFRNQSVEKVFVDMPKFAITEINSGSYLLCKLEPSGICPRIDGRILDSGHSGFAEFNHELGLYVQMELNDFLLKFFVEERLMTCNQYMKCDNPLGENQRCTIQMSCEKR